MNIEKIIENAELELAEEFKKIDKLSYENSKKVLKAFHNNKISEIHFNTTTGYGYNDLGRDVIEQVFAEILESEDALVRNNFISATHAIKTALFALLRPNDTLLSITGKPYDTLDEIIGIKENDSSLASYQIKYEQIDLINNDFNYEQIEKKLKEKEIKLIEIQRSIGYSTRKSINLKQIEKVIKFIKKISPNTIIMVDNCYCEFVSSFEPTHYGADIIIGSLIKNLGGGIAPNGAYIAGKKNLINLCAQNLTVPGQGKEVGPSLGINKSLLKGIYMAPSAVSSALKINLLTSKICEKLNIKTSPNSTEERTDLVLSIYFEDENKLINFIKGIQKGSAIDAHAICSPSKMPGYNDLIIMASGSFTQGSSIEISADGPIRPPYIAYLQGSLTYEYGKLALIEAFKNII